MSNYECVEFIAIMQRFMDIFTIIRVQASVLGYNFVSYFDTEKF